MRLRILDHSLHVTPCTARLPFRFGITTMTWAPYLTARVDIETGAGHATGYSADLLVPKWFDKNPDSSAEDDARALIESADAAARAAASLAPTTAFDLWWQLKDTVAPLSEAPVSRRLVAGFGVALVERAMLDAVCRAAGVSFFAALHDDVVGFDPGRVDPALAEWACRDCLGAPSTRVDLRHTVGLVDPITAADVPAGEAVTDGLPHTLVDDIDAHGLRYFKLKVSGDVDADLARLDAIGAVLAERAGDDAKITLDGNEQYASIDGLVELLDRLGTSQRGRWLLDRLLLIEQPLRRDHTFDPARHAAMSLLAGTPVIIDEADGDLDALPRAAALGYRGVSIKNCKGVFRALINRARCDRSPALFQSAEDLTNLPILALQQDLATIAALGPSHVERNGHHYFRGLDHLPAAEVAAALAHHGDLYEAAGDGARLSISGGRLEIGSLNCPGYGYAGPVDLDARTPARAFRWPGGSDAAMMAGG